MSHNTYKLDNNSNYFKDSLKYSETQNFVNKNFVNESGRQENVSAIDITFLYPFQMISNNFLLHVKVTYSFFLFVVTNWTKCCRESSSLERFKSTCWPTRLKLLAFEEINFGLEEMIFDENKFGL